MEGEGGTIRSKRQAQWYPLVCTPPGQQTATRPIEISIDKWQAKHWGQWYVNYAHNTKRMWPMLFSQNVEYARFRFDRFAVDTGDTLTLTGLNGSQTYTQYSPPLPWPGLNPYLQVKHTGNHTGATYLELAWQTNDSGTSTGYIIDGVALNCLTNPPPAANTTYVMRNWAYDGYLLGTDDVIWVHTTKPAGTEMSIVLWPVSPGADFDLYVSTDPANKFPSSSWSTFASYRGGSSSEMVLIPKSIDEQQVYISIGSFDGQGQFRFYANVHASGSIAGYPNEIRARTDWTPVTAHKEQIKTQIRKLAQALYWGTDGRHMIRTVDLYWNKTASPTYIQWVSSHQLTQCLNGNDHITLGAHGWCSAPELQACTTDANCDAGYFCHPDTKHCRCYPSTKNDCPCTNTQQHNERWAGNDPPHEVGHCYYNLPDEYKDNYGCGHSLMTNLDNYAMNNVDYCSVLNGGKNPFPPWVGHPAANNNWASLDSQFPSNPAYPQGYTPDAFYQTCEQSAGDLPFAGFVNIIEH